MRNRKSISKGTGYVIQPPPHQVLFNQLLLPVSVESTVAAMQALGAQAIMATFVCISAVLCHVLLLQHATKAAKGLVSLLNLVCQRATSRKFHHKIEIAVERKVRVIFDPGAGGRPAPNKLKARRMKRKKQRQISRL